MTLTTTRSILSTVLRSARWTLGPLLLNLSIAPLSCPCSAETLVLSHAIETVTDDLADSGFSSCGLSVGDPAKLTLQYSTNVEADFADDQSATFIGAIESYRFELGNLPVVGEETEFSENTIGVTDANGDGAIQFVNFRTTSITSNAELDLTAFHQLPDDLLDTPSDLSQVQGFLENSNQPFSTELWLDCEIAGSEGATLVTFQAVPEPLAVSLFMIGLLTLLTGRTSRTARALSEA